MHTHININYFQLSKEEQNFTKQQLNVEKKKEGKSTHTKSYTITHM